MDASYTGLPGEAKEAHQETMSRLNTKHPGLHDEAIAGSDQDFDKPLSAGLREHQRHLRDSAGLTHAEVLERRKAMRATRPPARRAAVKAGAQAGRAFYRSRPARQTGIPGAVTSTGSVVLQAVGIGIGLSLLYLVLSKRGSGAFSGSLNILSGALQAFIQPVDPLGFHPFSTSTKAPATVTLTEGPQVYSPKKIAQIQSKNSAFGPGPGIGKSLITSPIGGKG
jgi:hypothetical protein